MPSIFTKIIRGEIPCYKILEDERYFAFLEIRPLRPGHTLVIPKQEVDYFFDLDEPAMNGLFAFSKKVASAIKKATPCEKVAVVVYGPELAAPSLTVTVTGYEPALTYVWEIALCAVVTAGEPSPNVHV